MSLNLRNIRGLLTKASIALLVLILVTMPSQATADTAFPQNGSTLTYSLLTTAKTSQGNITAASTDSYTLQQVGNQWNVTETLSGKITCSPSAAQLNVKFHTRSDIMGINSSVSTDPNIEIPVSYVIQDRLIISTPISPNAPVGFTAKCSLGGTDVGTINQDTGAVLAGSMPGYVWFYIETAGVTQGSAVPISTVTATISGMQNVTVMSTSRPALVGTISGFISGSFYWDRDTGILLLEETTGLQSDRMQLVSSNLPFTGATTANLATTYASQARVVSSATTAMSSVLATGSETPVGLSLFSTTAIVGLGLVAVVAIAVLVLVMLRQRSSNVREVERRKSSEISAASPAPHKPTNSFSPPKPQSEHKVCRYCKTEVPQDRLICPKCGMPAGYL
jgi:hypothetical protein